MLGKKKPLVKTSGLNNGGGSEIRTHGGRKPSPVFKTGAFNHSTIPPLKTGAIIPRESCAVK